MTTPATTVVPTQLGSRIDQVLEAVVQIVAGALVAAGIPGGVVFPGNPEPIDLEAKLVERTKFNQFLVGVYAMPNPKRVPERTAAGMYYYGANTMSVESQKLERRIQVTAWAKTDVLQLSMQDPPTQSSRSIISGVITAAMGTQTKAWFPIGDGTKMRIRYQTEADSEKGIGNYKIFEYHVVFLVEYGLIETVPAYPVATFKTELGVDDNDLIELTKPDFTPPAP